MARMREPVTNLQLQTMQGLYHGLPRCLARNCRKRVHLGIMARPAYAVFDGEGNVRARAIDQPAIILCRSCARKYRWITRGS